MYLEWGVCEDDRWQVQGTLPKRGHTANHRAAPRARVDTRAGKIANMSTSLFIYLLISSVASWQRGSKVLSTINIRAAKTDWSGRRKSWTFLRLIFSICLHCGVAKNCTDLNTRYQLQQRTSSLNTQAGLTLFIVWSTEIDQDWPDSRSESFWAGYY